MPKSMKPTLFFLDGEVLGHGDIALAAQYNEYADVDASRVLLRLGGDWVKVDFDNDVIRSLAFAVETGTLFMLGKSGVVYTIGGKSVHFSKSTIKGTLAQQKVVDPEDRGELFKVRALRGRILTCGQGGQLLELGSRSWHSFGINDPVSTCPDFEDVTLDANGLPLAVGSAGSVYRFASSGARRLEAPTNQFLSSVITAPSGDIYACGNNGAVLSISDDLCNDLSVDLEPVRNLWSIALCRDALYVCEPSRLLKRILARGAAWEVVPFPEAPAPTFYRLSFEEGLLWSFGVDHVFCKGEQGWTQVRIPGNEFSP